MKIIGFIIIFFAILIVMRWWSAHQKNARNAASDANEKRTQVGVDTVKCVDCGSFIAKSQAALEAKGWHCADSNCAANNKNNSQNSQHSPSDTHTKS